MPNFNVVLKVENINFRNQYIIGCVHNNLKLILFKQCNSGKFFEELNFYNF